MSSNKTVVISQPMLFPWVGMFEQIRLADVFVFYDDVQFSKGSFTNRVQLKSEKGSEWMTIPLEKIRLGQHINEVVASRQVEWRKKHLGQLERCYAQATYFEEMMTLVEYVYDIRSDSLSELTMASMHAVCDYYDLSKSTSFCLSSAYNLAGKSSERVLDFVRYFQGSHYVTGLGALNYLDHELFDENGVSVEYMDYQKKPYQQLFGAFTPYVTILDLIANCGAEGKKYICSNAVHWREMKQRA